MKSAVPPGSGVTRTVNLAYPMSPDAPACPGLPSTQTRVLTSMHSGDTSDVYEVTICNHVGSHVDGPQHMRQNSGPLSDWISPDGLLSRHPLLVDIPCQPGELISAHRLAQVIVEDCPCDFLLIRTGAYAWRDSEATKYAQHNPGFSRAAAELLVDRCRSLRCIAIDSISVASMEHLDEGIAAHQVFFAQEPPVLLVEDVSADLPPGRLHALHMVPMLIEGLDSCPCVLLATIVE